jgi:hypothetical protein
VNEAAVAAHLPFSPGRTLSVSLAVFGRNFVPFLAIALVISLPYLAIQTWFDYEAAQGWPTAGASFGVGSGFVMFGVQTIIFGLIQAVLTYGTIQDLRGQRAGILDCFRGGFARAGEIVSGALMYGVLLALATLLLVIPGIVLYLHWWVFMPVMVVERLKSSESFERSKTLTKGRRWAILGLAAIVFLVQVALAVGLVLTIQGLVADVMLSLLVVVFTTFSSVVAAVGYYHLRLEKEGVIIDDIAMVFD